MLKIKESQLTKKDISKKINLNLGLSTKSGKQYAYFEGDISTVSSLDKNYLKKIGRKNKKKKIN